MVCLMPARCSPWATATSSCPAWAATCRPPPTTGDMRALVGRIRGGDSDRRRHRSVGLAAADCLERQIQIRAGRIRRPRHFADSGTDRSRSSSARLRFPAQRWPVWKSRFTGAWRTPGNAASCSRWTTDRKRGRASAGLWALAVVAVCAAVVGSRCKRL